MPGLASRARGSRRPPGIDDSAAGNTSNTTRNNNNNNNNNNASFGGSFGGFGGFGTTGGGGGFGGGGSDALYMRDDTGDAWEGSGWVLSAARSAGPAPAQDAHGDVMSAIHRMVGLRFV